MADWDRHNYSDGRQIGVCQQLGVSMEVNCKLVGANWGDEGSVLHLDCGGGYTAVYVYQTHQNVA